MDFKSLCEARYSVRAYKPDTIPAEKLEYVKECTRLAPSAVNKQPWKFFLFTREEDRRLMQQCYDREWFREAPAYVLACENHDEAWTRRYDEKNHADIDLAIAIEHLCPAAAEQGLEGLTESLIDDGKPVGKNCLHLGGNVRDDALQLLLGLLHVIPLVL